MLKVSVFIISINSDRLWDVERTLPPEVQISVNVNIVGIEEAGDGSLEAPFIFAVSYSPTVAQINMKGKAKITADPEEKVKLKQDYADQKGAPVQLLQAVSGVAIADAILLSKIIGVPPPVPPIHMLQATKTETKYTT